MSHQEDMTAFISSFVAELSIAGVEDVVISPGSRSTPIALIMAEHPRLRLHIHVDERSAAFFALGIAKASYRPVAILCTSGTAAANYYPAVIEAGISRVPLIVITADRPHELRDVGAPQAIDQIHLYGHNVKWFVEMSLPEAGEDSRRYARTVCARAATTAASFPSGPVHLNFPLREPLIPNLYEGMFDMLERPEGYVGIHQGKLTMPDSFFEKLADDLHSCEKGIIICGPLEEAGFVEEVVLLAEKLKFPILADPLSQLRSGGHSEKYIVDAYDTFLRNENVKEKLKPEVIIRFGAMPVSKALSIFLKENRNSRQIVVDGGNGWRDPFMSATDMIYADEPQFCKSISSFLCEEKENGYTRKWCELNNMTKDLLSRVRDTEELSEGKLFHMMAELLPENAVLFVGNSMPIRDLDTFFYFNKKNIRVMANRGANGIDGIISTASGVAAHSGPLYLVLGDLTFFHDLNGLLASKLNSLNINILLINNNGGGIFSFLPQASHPKHFEKLFGTPLDLDFRLATEMYGGTFDRISQWDGFREAIEKNMHKNGLKVMEIVTSRDVNLKEHRDLWNYVSREIDVLLEGGAQ
ncbi:2-succinyl-5-enolpyruvyl-6-hydroxy-3-cyclohexene-1-carboxylic-acid synthase [Mesobacillus zeae]|uniref:2-succinyl-5-enolpyruvyl-6-hydroxy-3-cyclohexene-1-carboxylate synthase n=1 Tax=Mesobacillus zeae TaxID=1917180 RepID=A0A398B134_9BACI|nr:2-succinyl-5-enolpyruvyl-6-hydroxy-3-cyclohexene-1-carboxylic-acid synthase [Mesobacillus zeae]RID83024.1 2-succinyl-5-enolpyruvyl-6-hydroxy-3-cyclohexene-1-carboxylic-acid synthase [Mesobacillus zeae]